jgi:hypothetical protein
MSGSPAPLESGGFPQFGQLPWELRDKIWEFQIVPRIVYVQVDGKYSLGTGSRSYPPHGSYNSYGSSRYRREKQLRYLLLASGGDWDKIPDLFLSSTSSLALFDTCAESRAMVLKHYSKLHFRGQPSSYIKPIWFNFELDTLYTDYDYEVFHPSRHDFIGDDVHKIHRLAIYFPAPKDSFVVGDLTDVLVHFKNLNSLTIVDRAHKHYPNEPVMTGGLCNLDHSLEVFGQKESESIEDVERERLSAEALHCREFMKEMPSQFIIETRWLRLHSDARIRPTMPAIKYDTITTRWKWDRYCKAKKQYDARMNMYEIARKIQNI